MKIIPVPVAVIALLAGISVAAAADHGLSKSGTTGAASSMSLPAAKDTLSLNSSQQDIAWRDIGDYALKEDVPTGFTAKVGEAVPDAMAIHPVPVTTAAQVPQLRPYDYALLRSKKLLIVNPNDKKIAEIITR